MKILLIGEYSNVHHTLAMGLRALGHEVTVASDGDTWKNYPRDVDLRRYSYAPWGTVRYLLRVCKLFRTFKGYDVVQLINPVFLPLRAERLWRFYRFLRRNNRHVVMGAFGMDHYYIKACLDFATFRYSDFNFGSQERVSEENRIFKRDWLTGPKGVLNRRIAQDCDAVVAGLYEYYAAYCSHFEQPEKLHFIPFPIVLSPLGDGVPAREPDAPLRLFIGVQQSRSAYKGTDIMLRAAERIVRDYPDGCRLAKAQNVPFDEYVRLMNGSEAILDQLYSYTPAMNALEAMSRGLINIGGAEPENYEVLGENELRPMLNVQPDEESVYQALQQLVVHRNDWVPKMQRESREYIARHHEHVKVARSYEQLYLNLERAADVYKK